MLFSKMKPERKFGDLMLRWGPMELRFQEQGTHPSGKWTAEINDDYSLEVFVNLGEETEYAYGASLEDENGKASILTASSGATPQLALDALAKKIDSERDAARGRLRVLDAVKSTLLPPLTERAHAVAKGTSKRRKP